MHLNIVAIVFVVIFLAELPDKSLFGALILGSRYPKKIVWLGAATAFLFHVIIAVSAGHFIALLPHKLVGIVVSVLFLGGSILLFFGKHGLEAESTSRAKSFNKSPTFLKVFSTAFGVTFVGEWGDITQITTANYAARYHDPWSVGVGAILALWAVTALAVTLGVKALTFIPARVLRTLTATILFIFALISALSVIKAY